MNFLPGDFDLPGLFFLSPFSSGPAICPLSLRSTVCIQCDSEAGAGAVTRRAGHRKDLGGLPRLHEGPHLLPSLHPRDSICQGSPGKSSSFFQRIFIISTCFACIIKKQHLFISRSILHIHTIRSYISQDACVYMIIQYITVVPFCCLPLLITQARERISNTVKGIIEERRTAGSCKKQDDFLDVLLSSNELSDEEKVSFVLDSLLGGYETTSLLISMVVYFLGQSAEDLGLVKVIYMLYFHCEGTANLCAGGRQ